MQSFVGIVENAVQPTSCASDDSNPYPTPTLLQSSSTLSTHNGMPLSPIISSCLLSLAISSVSNVIAQKLKAYNEGVPFVFDHVLFYRFITMCIITTPFNYYWQMYLEWAFPGWKVVKPDGPVAIGDAEKGYVLKDDGEDKRAKNDEVRVRNWFNIFNKWFTDCITLGALFNTTLFLVLMGILEGKTGLQIQDDLKKELWPIIWDSYKVWPVANFVSTTYIPAERRIVFLSFFGLVWSVYLTLVAGRL